MRGNIVHVHAFAEELNTCRTTSATLARSLSRLGYAVLQLDLYGCGDSEGDFADARWPVWKRDIVTALQWLQQRHPAPLHLWGDRLGAALALDTAHDIAHEATLQPLESLLLCQPILQGEAYMTQFLRLRLASTMLQGETTGGTKQLRARLLAGEALEIAGYTLNGELFSAIDQLAVRQWALPNTRLHWLEMLSPSQATWPPARQSVANHLQQSHPALQLHTVTGSAFWNATVTTVVKPWIDAAGAIFSGYA